MKQSIYLLIISGAICFTSCVQKTYERKVKFILNVSKVDNIQSVGVRGSNSPLHWEKDFEMKPVFGDSIYTADITFITGYLGAEVKFVINGQFELQNQESRRFAFDTAKDTTLYRAIFDQIK